MLTMLNHTMAKGEVDSSNVCFIQHTHRYCSVERREKTCNKYLPFSLRASSSSLLIILLFPSTFQGLLPREIHPSPYASFRMQRVALKWMELEISYVISYGTPDLLSGRYTQYMDQWRKSFQHCFIWDSWNVRLHHHLLLSCLCCWHRGVPEIKFDALLMCLLIR